MAIICKHLHLDTLSTCTLRSGGRLCHTSEDGTPEVRWSLCHSHECETLVLDVAMPVTYNSHSLGFLCLVTWYYWRIRFVWVFFPLMIIIWLPQLQTSSPHMTGCKVSSLLTFPFLIKKKDFFSQIFPANLPFISMVKVFTCLTLTWYREIKCLWMLWIKDLKMFSVKDQLINSLLFVSM